MTFKRAAIMAMASLLLVAPAYAQTTPPNAATQDAEHNSAAAGGPPSGLTPHKRTPRPPKLTRAQLAARAAAHDRTPAAAAGAGGQ